jgi:hypothetical protein
VSEPLQMTAEAAQTISSNAKAVHSLSATIIAQVQQKSPYIPARSQAGIDELEKAQSRDQEQYISMPKGEIAHRQR